MKSDEEKILVHQMKKVKNEISNYYKIMKYKQCLKLLFNLIDPTENFFEKIVIVHQNLDIRRNRLVLLNKLFILLNSVVNLSFFL
ncbi:hypothetical protein AOE58_02465 [Candidatus Riesia pthiripubis]|uniref:DALR anticodon binding domain-containing protein n=1 Tax=Candidatus Riesia pthiripubis TaxID=428412 RepID=A0A1V0HP96_9ENTR|nr:hypothetical protein AOE58_02465 [Candidatus Riesia pthiripubis]